MKPATAALWNKHSSHVQERVGLFTAVADFVDAETVLYPGSFIDLAPSCVFASVTYLDVDRRAPRFFADGAGVGEIVADLGGPARPHVCFIHADYTAPFDLLAEQVDLLVSLYAGFVSPHCTEHLRVGGTLLVNSSHGDAAMASLDPRYELAGVVELRNRNYRVRTADLGGYLVPKKPQTVTAEQLRARGRGIAYTRSPFAYLFQRTQ